MWVDIDSDDVAVLNAVKPSPVIKRGRKGESRAFQFNPDVPSCKVAGCIDILAYGRQTVLPPTIHPETQKPYVWLTTDTIESFSRDELPTFTPDDLNDLRRILEPAQFEAGDTSGVSLQGPFYNDDPKRGCPHGSHDRLKRICTALIGRGASPDEAVRELLRYDDENHKPTGYFSDTTRSDCFADPASNALFFYSSNLRTFNRRQVKSGLLPTIPLVSGSEFIDVSAVTARAQQAQAFQPMAYPEPYGTLKDIRDLILKYSIREQHGLALGGAISLGAAAISNKLRFGDIWPNVYVLNVAPTGSGKSFPQNAIKRILSPENGFALIGSGGYRSSAAILNAVEGRRERIDLIDECSGMFRTIRDGGVFQADMMDILNALWADSNSIYLAPESAGKERVSVWNPCISALMSTTPEGLKTSVSRDFVTQGFLPRCLILHDADYGKLKDEAAWDEQLERKIVDFLLPLQDMGDEQKGKRNFVMAKPQPAEIPVSAEALEHLKHYSRECAERLSHTDTDEIERHFLSRAPQQARKLALIQGALWRVEINLESALWATETLEAIWHNASTLLPQTTAENVTETNVMRVLAMIKSAGAIHHSKLIGRTRYLKTAERHDILSSLENEGKIRGMVNENRAKIWAIV
ncbi:unnamed protein product [Sphagnum balticum]